MHASCTYKVTRAGTRTCMHHEVVINTFFFYLHCTVISKWCNGCVCAYMHLASKELKININTHATHTHTHRMFMWINNIGIGTGWV